MDTPNRLGLSEQQIAEAMSYIEAHRDEVAGEYRFVLQDAEQNRRYWEDLNRERLAWIATQPAKVGQHALRETLAGWRIEADTDR